MDVERRAPEYFKESGIDPALLSTRDWVYIIEKLLYERDHLRGIREERDVLLEMYNIIQSRRVKGDFCLCGFRGPTFHGTDCPVGRYEALSGPHHHRAAGIEGQG